MALNGKKNSIVTFIKARNLSGLRRLILKTESKDGYFYDWDIHQDKDGSWVAFYRKELGGMDQTLREMGEGE